MGGKMNVTCVATTCFVLLVTKLTLGVFTTVKIICCNKSTSLFENHIIKRYGKFS